MTKVMLVEDDNNLREIYEARLQAEGYDIVAAKDGEEALVLAKEHKPELVISDVMMPKISGFEMLDILRNTDGLKDVKVIMLTALGQSDDQARADKLGADRYLVKSQVTLEDIVTVARELIDGPAAPEAAPAVDAMAAIAATPDPVVPAEPVAVAPEPVAAPELTSKTPVPESDPVSASDSTTPQSTAQEEASVEAKIEDFVAGASSDPGVTTPATPDPVVPAEPVSAAPEPTVTEPVAVAPEPVALPAPATPDPVVPTLVPEPSIVAEQAAESKALTDAATATDDKLMADAVDALMANTKDNAESVSPAAGPPVIVPDKTQEAIEPDEKTASEHSSVPISGKKVISPVDSSEAPPSIESLLAKEEAKNIQAGAAVPPATPIAPTTVIAPGDKDPNSIAL